MTLRELVNFFKNFFFIFAFFILATIGIAHHVNQTTTVLYTAETTIFVATPATVSAINDNGEMGPVPNNSAINSLAIGSSFSLQRVASYAEIIANDTTLTPVIKSLNLPYDASTLARRVKTTVFPLTVLIKIEVTDESPDLAAKIANQITLQFSSTAKLLEIGSSTGKSTGPVKITTVSTAQPPKIPSSPKKTRNYFIGFVAGLVLALGVINLRGFFDRKMRNESHLDGIPLVGTVRFMKGMHKQLAENESENFSEKAETYRMIRTNIQFLREGRKSLIVAITSCLPQEGKSTTALNLAISCANAGIKTLLIEGDMRRPSFASFSNNTQELSATDLNGLGLSELLTHPIELTPRNIAKYSRKIPDLDLAVIPSGANPPNPAEILTSDRLDKLLSVVRTKFELVFIDSPPALAVTDAVTIAQKSDATVLVVFAGNTTIEQFQIVKRVFETVESGLSGVILNKIPRRRTGKGSYGYYYGGEKERSGVYFTPMGEYYGKYEEGYSYGSSAAKKPIQDSFKSQIFEEYSLLARLGKLLKMVKQFGKTLQFNASESAGKILKSLKKSHMSKHDSSVEAIMDSILREVSQRSKKK